LLIRATDFHKKMKSFYYNDAGQFIQTISHDGSSTVFDYNELGERTATISVAAGQTLDFNPLSFTLANVVLLDKYVISLTTESLAQHSRNQFFPPRISTNIAL